MKERLHYIDIAKGIGIILVVWFHMPYLDRLPQFHLWGGVHNHFLYASLLLDERFVL